MFVATFVSVLIFSVVAAAVSAPPIVTALASALTVASGSVGKWCTSLWKRYEKEVKEQMGLTTTMELFARITICDMDDIRVLVTNLEIKIESLLKTADFALGEEDALKLAMDEIKKKLGEFMEIIEKLGVVVLHIVMLMNRISLLPLAVRRLDLLSATMTSSTVPIRTDKVINSLPVDSDLRSLMMGYFANFENTLEYCTALKDCLEHATTNHSIIESAVKCYDEEAELGVGTVENNSVKALEELRRFRAAEEPFVMEFLELKRMAHMRYESMQGKVCARKKTLEKKVESWETWRTVSMAFLVAAFISVLVVSVVAVIKSAKPVIISLAGALTTAIVPLGTWCNKWWKRNKEKIKMKKKLTAIMEIFGSSATTIWMLVEQLEIKKASLSHSVDYVLTEGYTLKAGMDDINEKLKLVKPIITDLLRETNEYCSCKFRKDLKEIQRQMMHML
ncbi:hypothetical protein Golob_022549 [Gossypium lobatum]|uniref:Uncharacterized protein n=1 Tax=Gossypium lobatum TaxID=34289 RepID=A0A7J8LGW7_9ROSI|nr:hypothetical protein [Gossypium lobatum]